MPSTATRRAGARGPRFPRSWLPGWSVQRAWARHRIHVDAERIANGRSPVNWPPLSTRRPGSRSSPRRRVQNPFARADLDTWLHSELIDDRFLPQRERLGAKQREDARRCPKCDTPLRGSVARIGSSAGRVGGAQMCTSSNVVAEATPTRRPSPSAFVRRNTSGSAMSPPRFDR